MKRGIYCVVFKNGYAKFGMSSNLDRRTGQYKREIEFAGGADIATLECDNYVSAERALLDLARSRYESKQRELFVGVTYDAAVSLLSEAIEKTSACAPFIPDPRNPVDVLAANLIRIMDESGMSQSDVARLCAVDQTTIGRMVNRKNAAQIDKVNDIARVFGMEAWQLLSPANICEC